MQWMKLVTCNPGGRRLLRQCDRRDSDWQGP